MNQLPYTLELLSFPPSSRADIIAAGLRLGRDAEYSSYLEDAARSYRENGTVDYSALAARAGELATQNGVHAYTGALLFFLRLVPDARSFYHTEGREEALFRASFSDLRLKSIECYKVHGVWGVDTHWFGRFYDRTRFLLGRLEFEDESLAYPFWEYPAGAPVINVHIPECGPLWHEECLASYALAVQAFPHCVRDGKAVFVCSSWLLAEELRTFLPPSSNILRFAADFTVLHRSVEQGFPDGWRVFADKCKLPPSELPRETVLQRGYADYLMTHESTTVGYGAFIFDTETNTIAK